MREGVLMPLHVYIAAGLHTPPQRARNAYLSKQLEASGFTVYLPQRDGGLYLDLIKNGNLQPDEAATTVYQADVAAIRKCDVLVATFSDLQPDAGTIFEVGFANAIGKPIILRPEGGHPLNPMLRCAGLRIPLSHTRLLQALAAINHPS